MQDYVAGLLQSSQRLDGCFEFHSIVGGQTFRAGKLSFVGAELENGSPASRSRIAAAGSVGINRDLLLQTMTDGRPERLRAGKVRMTFESATVVNESGGVQRNESRKSPRRLPSARDVVTVGRL